MPKRQRDMINIEIPSKAIRIRHCVCPKGHSLMDAGHKINGYDSVVVLATCGEQEGLIYLDPVYGSFKNVIEIDVPDQGVVEFFCPDCQTSLVSKQHRCPECDAPMFEIHLKHGGMVSGCLRNGCHYHNLKLADGEAFVDKLAQEDDLDVFL